MDHFASTHSTQQKRTPEQVERVEAPNPKRTKTEPVPKPAKKPTKTPLQKLVERKDKPVTPSLSYRDQQEDQYISYLESKLGWKKNGSKTGAYGSGLGEDGLDGKLFILALSYREF